MIKAIIFDCFGVLAGSSFKEIFRQAGGNLAADEPFVDDILAAANSGFITGREMHERVAEHLGISLDKWISFINNRELPNEVLLDYIKTLKSHYKLAILSNANRGVLPRKFNAEQLALFDVVVASAEVGCMKPDPQIYQLVSERLGVEPRECIFIDDSQHYLEPAAGLGMQTIWYQNFEQCQAELEHILSTTKT